MVISIWGRDGSGKSTLSDSLGVFFSGKGTCIVVDTDLTQPTIPMRCLASKQKGTKSPLGKALTSVTTDVRPYLHQHAVHKGLFYAGLRDGDDYLSYEMGLGAEGSARNFVDRCAEAADTVILDLSDQRSEPFLPVGLEANHIVLPITPDLQGICWYLSVRWLLRSLGALEHVLPVASQAQLSQSIPNVEKAGEFTFAAVIPWIREIADRCDTGEPALVNRKYAKALQPLVDKLTGGGANA